jgi:hypothetical protein
LRRARAMLVELAAEKRERAIRNAKGKAAKSAPSVSTSEPQVRSMKMADGATVRVGCLLHALAYSLLLPPLDRGSRPGRRRARQRTHRGAFRRAAAVWRPGRISPLATQRSGGQSIS